MVPSPIRLTSRPESPSFRNFIAHSSCWRSVCALSARCRKCCVAGFPAIAKTTIAAKALLSRLECQASNETCRSARPMPSASNREKKGSSLIVTLVAATFFMENLDGTIIATALPQMARSFNVHPADMSLGITAYLLTLAVFIPISGWAADRFGLRTVFASAIAVFTAASVLCATTSTLPAFAAARVLQGIGGAMMVPVGRLAVLRATPKEGLMRAIAIITWPGLVAPVIGPPLGGFITTYSSWRWIFYLNVPLGLIGLLLTWRFVDNVREDAQRRFDFAGFVLCGIACVTLLYAMELVGRNDASW